MDPGPHNGVGPGGVGQSEKFFIDSTDILSRLRQRQAVPLKSPATIDLGNHKSTNGLDDFLGNTVTPAIADGSEGLLFFHFFIFSFYFFHFFIFLSSFFLFLHIFIFRIFSIFSFFFIFSFFHFFTFCMFLFFHFSSFLFFHFFIFSFFSMFFLPKAPLGASRPSQKHRF